MAEISTTREPSSPPSGPPAAKKARLDDPPKVDVQGDAAPPPGNAKPPKKSKKQKFKDLPEACSSEDVLWQEIKDILGAEYVDTAVKEGTVRKSPFEQRQELEVEVVAMSSSGTALATSSSASRPWVVVVPFCVPGETARVRVYNNSRLHSVADLIEVITPNPTIRDDSLVECKYFGTCGGCQYQMLSYEKQLELKRDVVVKAYTKFSDIPSSSMPPIESTMPSPLQYNYRTKITPHFNAPNKTQRSNPDNPQNDTDKPSWFNIGFNRVGTQKVIDIEDCPISTPVIRAALPAVRANAIANLYTYKKGVSLILRDSLPLSTTNADIAENGEPKHICVTNHRGRVRERVGPNLFEYPASSFFQNNNCVMPSLVSYVRERIFDSAPSDTPTPTHLVDTYCGAGLFAISLASSFKIVAGIELSVESIQAASINAKLNSLPPFPRPVGTSKDNVNRMITFQPGDATQIFSVVSKFPASETVVVIDPPRKGCDEPFIEQLVGFGAQTVVYVSCNVHTQARDVGMILRRDVGGKDGKAKGKYVLESVRGFDLFPQTAHVESVAVLRLVEGQTEGMDVDSAV
ncbi:S-adenosyl-L-methionine-dependent methyltransferase [Roridomyces roridus]|uniref:S-adenosyl-L-methionine-dependent methyltransferase n=1 Tax=Roridomyces roridus TaxID=1738132 RepID=A0AAD7FZT5_9AGAR|nr:S-adenosyl-L-methionine-dependent methyltransferase [Roridomyces roridus]